MKNVLIHLNPTETFDRERAKLVRIQIDNSYDLGWKASDILLVTNFEYEYNGIKALVIDGDHFCRFRPRSTNTVTIPHLFDLGLIEGEKTYWVHDFDAYQLHPMQPVLEKDAGFTTYGWSPKWCLGSFFFKQGAQDIFQWIKEMVYTWETEDERALVSLTKHNRQGINDRYQVMNITYNFGMRHVGHNYELAEKPLKVLHFHPYYRETGLYPLDVFRNGNNELGKPLMTERLIKIFADHGI